MRGLFITIEGGDGAGKTTQVELLRGYLASRGYPVVCTQEPGGTRIGEQIRGILLNNRNTEMTATTELLLYAAARAQHVREVIRPALAQGKVVICSRFTDSTVAYQGYGGGVDRDLIDNLNAVATEGIRPDLTLLFDLAPERGLARVRQRTGEEGGTGDRIEQRALDYHARVRAGFLQLAIAAPDRVRVVAADRPVEIIHGEIKQWVEERLARSAGGPRREAEK